MKALDLLKKVSSVEERADSIIAAVSRDVNQREIEPLLRKKERLEDEIADLENMNLSTDLNKGQLALTKEEVIKRFQLLVSKKYELQLTNKELEVKTQIYNDYFVEVVKLEA
jgi:hypothetical protein